VTIAILEFEDGTKETVNLSDKEAGDVFRTAEYKGKPVVSYEIPRRAGDTREPNRISFH
jgi:hypothetical protein